MGARAIVYYVTSHGYGHLNRAAAVVSGLPRNVHVVVKTERSLWDRWREAVERPCELADGVFDCGAVNPAGDSSGVDGQATLKKYHRVHQQALAALDQEVDFLRSGRFAAVVSDIASLPLVAAARAGLPGLLVANFTWKEIFQPYVAKAGRQFARMLREMTAEYAQATALLRAEPALPLADFRRVIPVGLVSRPGRNRRRELLRELRLPSDVRLVFVYVGRYGQADMCWERIERLGEFHFVSYHELDGAFPNWHVLTADRWPPGGLMASVDAAVAKAGYGTVTDCLSTRTPLVFPPRHGFREHRVLAAALRRWGGGLGIPMRQFKQLAWRRALQAACALRPARPPWPTDGAQRCARAILRFARD